MWYVELQTVNRYYCYELLSVYPRLYLEFCIVPSLCVTYLDLWIVFGLMKAVEICPYYRSLTLMELSPS
jgi:hypothetical protein